MEKKFYFLIILTFLIMIFGGIFLWSKYSQEENGWLPAVRFEPPENYVFVDTDQGKIVKNEKAGISFNVPDKWTVDKENVGLDEWIVNVSSPDAEAGKDDSLIKGCGISAWIEYDKVTAHLIEEKIKDPDWFSGEISGGYSALKVNNQPALKTVLENPKWGQAVSIEIPENDKIYKFDTRFLPNDAEKDNCSQEFEEFLKGILIK